MRVTNKLPKGHSQYIRTENPLHKYNLKKPTCASKGPFKHYVTKRWVGGVRKWQFLMIYSTVNHQRWVGRLKNVENMMT